MKDYQVNKNALQVLFSCYEYFKQTENLVIHDKLDFFESLKSECALFFELDYISYVENQRFCLSKLISKFSIWFSKFGDLDVNEIAKEHIQIYRYFLKQTFNLISEQVLTNLTKNELKIIYNKYVNHTFDNLPIIYNAICEEE